MEDKGAPTPRFSVAILAGGRSRRLGRDKALMELGGEPLLQRTVRTLSVLSDDLIIVTGSGSRYLELGLTARIVPDEQPGAGSLMGIYSGLKAARYSRALAVGCDMPLLNIALLRYMATLTDGYDVVVPRLESYFEPLHAFYDKSCLPFMAQLLAKGKPQIIGLFLETRVRYVDREEVERFDPSLHSFLNVNTPQDWAEAERLVCGDSDSDPV